MHTPWINLDTPWLHLRLSVLQNVKKIAAQFFKICTKWTSGISKCRTSTSKFMPVVHPSDRIGRERTRRQTGHYSALSLKRKNKIVGLMKHRDHTQARVCSWRLSGPFSRFENHSNDSHFVQNFRFVLVGLSCSFTVPFRKVFGLFRREKKFQIVSMMIIYHTEVFLKWKEIYIYILLSLFERKTVATCCERFKTWLLNENHPGQFALPLHDAFLDPRITPYYDRGLIAWSRGLIEAG